jgi:mannose-6-phosphate isomerase
MSNPTVRDNENLKITTFIESEFFSVYKWDVSGTSTFSYHDQYLLLSVIKGEGTLVHNGEEYELAKGDHLIIPVGMGEFEIAGKCELIVSHT